MFQYKMTEHHSDAILFPNSEQRPKKPLEALEADSVLQQ